MDLRVKKVSFVVSKPNPFCRARLVDSSQCLHSSCAKAESVFYIDLIMGLLGPFILFISSLVC